MAQSLERSRERLAEYFGILAENLEDGRHSDDWLDVLEEAVDLAHKVVEMEDAEDGEEG